VFLELVENCRICCFAELYDGEFRRVFIDKAMDSCRVRYIRVQPSKLVLVLAYLEISMTQAL
jgi:hypothetical protein